MRAGPATDGSGKASPEAARLHIRLIGRFSLRHGDRDIDIESRKAKALIGYLALAPGVRESRERLLGLLWSEVDDEHARASLRQTLFQIRQAMTAANFDGFNADKIGVWFEPNRVAIDLLDVMRDAERGEPHPLLLADDSALDDLLREFETIDDSYRVWLLARRQAAQDRLVARLEDTLRSPGLDKGAREKTSRALIRIDPTHEEAARALIRIRAEAGDVGAALGVYKSLWDLLDNEYDVEPSRETQELIAQVKLAQPFNGASQNHTPIEPRDVAPPANAAPAVRLVLCVGGFDLKGTREENRYLIEGFRRELIGCLVRFREWVVRDQAVSAGQPSVGGQPGEYILDASAFESAEGVRLLLMLRNASTNDYLWSERFQLGIDRWFDAQQSIVRRLSTALSLSLSTRRLESLITAPHTDQIAFDLWLQAQSVIRNFNLRDWTRATAIMESIIERYPTFAPAYSSLAQLNNLIHISMPGVFRNAVRTEQALHYARQAGKLDPIDSRSQLCLGWSHAMAKQPELSEIHMRLAHELNENDHWTLVSASNCLAFCGATDEAAAIEKQLFALPAPPSPVQLAYLASNRFMAEDYEGCASAAASAGDTSATALGFRAAALQLLGRADEAREAKDRLFKTARERWSGDAKPDDDAVTRWFLHLFPIRRAEDWSRLMDGIRGAGAPPVDLRHNEW
ncbi:MAG: BTAD domain-containing putative transcriptional regulator [Beijerinckiaceae bacterium]